MDLNIHKRETMRCHWQDKKEKLEIVVNSELEALTGRVREV